MQDAADDVALDEVERRSWHEPQAQQCVCCGNPPMSSAPAVLMPSSPTDPGCGQGRDRRLLAAQTVPQRSRDAPVPVAGVRRCGLLFLDKRFSDGEMARLYGGYRGRPTPPSAVSRAGLPAACEAWRRAPRTSRSGLAWCPSWGGCRCPCWIEGDTGRNTPFRGKVETCASMTSAVGTCCRAAAASARTRPWAASTSWSCWAKCSSICLPGRELKKLRECLGRTAGCMSSCRLRP